MVVLYNLPNRFIMASMTRETFLARPHLFLDDDCETVTIIPYDAPNHDGSDNSFVLSCKELPRLAVERYLKEIGL